MGGFKKSRYKPHLKKCWCINEGQDADFVARMEDVLEVYSRPFDPLVPVVCMDEKPLQLLGEEKQEIIRESDGVRLQDERYIRNGTCSIFLFTEPLGGWRRAEALPQRRKVDWANQIKKLVDEDYPDAERIVLVMDNLNTHSVSSLYEAFPPDEAFRIMRKLEIHHTPKHGSWLDIAEIELSALTNQCLDKRRIDNIEDLNAEMSTWYHDRNNSQKGVSGTSGPRTRA